jgi:hypothetical protein
MRVLLGLAVVAHLASIALGQAAQTLTPATVTGTPTSAAYISGDTAAATIYVYSVSGGVNTQIPSSNFLSSSGYQGSSFINTGSVQTGSVTNFAFNIPYTTSTLMWTFATNAYTAQIQYKYWVSGAVSSVICDPCCTGCDVNNGPTGTGTTGSGVSASYNGWPCASFTRSYTYANLQTGTNYLQVGLYDRNKNPGPDAISYSFVVTKTASPIVGDPQIYGLQGQDFQVHGIPDEIFNLVTYPNLQVNARFVYLSSAECHDNFTACFAHPGTYIGEEGIKLGNDKIHVKAGSYKQGLKVSVNGQRISGKHSVKLGSVNVMSHRRVVISTPIITLTISNSDKFLNQETTLHDNKLLSLGSERRVLNDGEQFHPEVPLHGLQGQTWRNVEYPSGLEYEGSINDYHVVDGNLFGSDFVFNQFKL